jgi:hypothetical protein
MLQLIPQEDFCCCAKCKCVNGRLKIHEIAEQVFIPYVMPDNSAAEE